MKKRKVNKKIIKKKLPKGINAMTMRTGTIYIDPRLSPVQQKIAKKHELTHRKQIADGKLWFDSEFVYWNGKKFDRKVMEKGSKTNPWEKPAYKNQKNA
tara:strand:- start:351 stop:647 length:297 start_codon:yes stop_codon:yes gene_type:complete